MRNLLLLSLLPLAVFAKDKDHMVVKADIHCFKYQNVIKDLKEKYKEEPVFIGKSDLEEKTVTMMFIQQETGAYTVITTDRQVACVLDVGSDVIYRLPKSLESKLM